MLALPFILHTNELLQYNILRSFFFTSKEQHAFVLIQSSQWLQRYIKINAYCFKQNKKYIKIYIKKNLKI